MVSSCPVKERSGNIHVYFLQVASERYAVPRYVYTVYGWRYWRCCLLGWYLSHRHCEGVFTLVDSLLVSVAGRQYCESRPTVQGLYGLRKEGICFWRCEGLFPRFYTLYHSCFLRKRCMLRLLRTKQGYYEQDVLTLHMMRFMSV